MTPPQLTRDAPVLDIVEPLVVGGAPVFRDEFDFAVRHFFERHFGNRFAGEVCAFRCRFAHRDKPLVGQHRFDHDAGPVAARHHQFVRLDQFEQALRFEVGDDLLARREAVHALILGRRVLIDLGVERENADLCQVVALADCIVVHVMRRRNLHATGAEFLVHIVIGNDRDFAAGQRQCQRLADQCHVALIGRIDRDRDVAQHGLGTCRCNRQIPAAIRQRIADKPHRAVFFLGHDFQVGHRSTQDRVPVDQAFAAIDQALLEQAHEDFGDAFRHAFVHREILTAPIGRCA